MIRATPLAVLGQQYASTPLGAFASNEGPAFLLVEKITRSAGVEKRFLTTLAASEETSTPWPVDASAVLVFALASGGAPPDFEALLGRGPENHIQLDDPAVSKAHLRFVHDAPSGSFGVCDTDSQNGTRLNGSPLGPSVQPLEDRDELEIAERFRAVFMTARSLHRHFTGQAALAGHTGQARHEALRAVGLLSGKVAIITGAGRGLGRAYALRLAEEGCKVVVNDNGAEPDGTGTDPNVAPQVVAEIEAAGGMAVASLHDVSDRSEVEALLRLAVERFGPVDILVCSAGALVLGPGVLDPADEVWERLMAINARGAYLCVQAVARHMVDSQRPGRIVLTSSMVALTGNPGCIAYSASKAAILGLATSAAVELAPHAIAVNALTPMAWTRLTNMVPAIAAIPGVDEVLSPRRVADVVLFLVSELATGITGQIVDVGGAELSLYRTQRMAPLPPREARWTPRELQRRWPELIKT